jgi:hypothetical protein
MFIRWQSRKRRRPAFGPTANNLVDGRTDAHLGDYHAHDRRGCGHRGHDTASITVVTMVVVPYDDDAGEYSSTKPPGRGGGGVSERGPNRVCKFAGFCRFQPVATGLICKHAPSRIKDIVQQAILSH